MPRLYHRCTLANIKCALLAAIRLYPLEIYGVPFMLTKRSSHRTQYGPLWHNYVHGVYYSLVSIC